MVAILHFSVYSHFYDLRIIDNAYLFVDFFFVLSGFVIVANYRHRLIAGFSFRKFMWLRLGRIYPMHLVTVVAFAGIGFQEIWQRDGFSSETSLDAIWVAVMNVLLLHSLNTLDSLSLNFPSWSISVEFFTYALFALLIIILRRKAWIGEAVLIIVCPILLIQLTPNGSMDITYDYGLIRCLFGFCVGGIGFTIYRKLEQKISLDFRTATILEIVAVTCVAVFIALAGETLWSIASPIIFLAALLIFTQEAGAVSRLLCIRPMLALGALSYSIYMTHAFVEMLIYTVARDMGGKLFFDSQNNRRLFDVERWQGDLLILLMLAITVAISMMTYRHIERPANEWFRKRAENWR